MKISTNNIGNYSIHTPVISPQNNLQKPISAKKNEEISSDEKNFFIKKYPNKKSEIIDYHFYQKGGSMSGVKLGQLFDKKG